MIRAVLFDIDGTLILSGGAGEKAFGRVAELEFRQPGGTAGLRFAGRTDTGIVREFFQRHGIEPHQDNFRRFFEAYVFWLDHFLHEITGRVLPGVERWLADCINSPQRPVIGLLTGNIRLGAEIKLRHYRLWQHFGPGAFGDDHEDRNKIAVIARQRLGERLGQSLPGEEILIIGDTPLDIACARTIDARCLAVATGHFSVAQLREHQPAWVAETLEKVSWDELAAG